jgi:hypothetical protein
MLSFIPPSRDTVSHLTAQLAAEAVDAELAQRRYQDLALAAADGAADQKQADKAHDAYVLAAQRHSRTGRTLEAARARAADQVAQQAQAAVAVELAKCQQLIQARAKCAELTGKAIDALVAAVESQRKATAAIEMALPPRFANAQRDGLWLESDELQRSVEGELKRLRVWGGPEPLHAYRPYAEKFGEAVGLMRQRAAELLGKQS